MSTEIPSESVTIPAAAGTVDPIEALDEWKDRFNALVQAMKAMGMDFKHICKLVQKNCKRRKKRTESDVNKPVGFKVPRNISPDLAAFFGVPADTMLPRTEITKRIWTYIRDNELKDEQNKRIIDLSKPGGAALRDLLNPGEEPVSLSNMQRFLAVHIHTKAMTTATTEPIETPVETPTPKSRPIPKSVALKKK